MSNRQDNASLLHVLPFVIEVPVQISTTFFIDLPWGGAAIMGMQGILAGPISLPFILIANESPFTYNFTFKAISKKEKERLHVAKYINDYTNTTGTIIYTGITEGGEPPDFTATFKETQVGLDCTQFTIASRRTANGLFENLRNTILQGERKDFLPLKNSIVYMFFGKEGKIALPLRKDKHSELKEVLNALKNYKVDASSITFPYGSTKPMPDSFRIPYSYTQYGCTFYAVPMIGATPSSYFYTSVGFELGLAYNTTHFLSDIVSEVERIVIKHDKPAVNHLLITVGGPNEKGIGFFSEEALMEFALAQPFSMQRLSYIKQIHVHFWSTGRIVQLLPTIQNISQGVSIGFSPAYYQNIPYSESS